MIRLPKEAGGHRLIGILATLYRVWGKVRRAVCEKWERRHNDGTDYATGGQSAQRAAWDFAVENEAVEGTQGSTIAWLGDMEKCYELIPYPYILEEARATGFSATVTKLAINKYTGRRRIVQDKAYSKAVVANRGIIV